jgi:exo-beta-1,3-glucanase (GH17 family)
MKRRRVPTASRSRARRRLVFEFLETRLLLTADIVYQTYGLNFSPYIAPGENPDTGVTGQITESELRQRVAVVAPYTQWLRTFGCTGDLEPATQIIRGEFGKSVAAGAWIGSNAASNQAEIDALVEQAINRHVDLAIVGSEVLLRGDVSAATLVDYIDNVKARLAAADIHIPVTTADVYGALLAHPEVVDAVDVVFANYYPLWEGTSIDTAVAHLHQMHQQLTTAAGGKEVIVSETGWPSAGEPVGNAVPSPDNAAYYFQNFVSWARATDVKYFYFATYDEAWKVVKEGERGRHWGIFDAGGELKPGMERVFNSETLLDNWSNTAVGPTTFDFFNSPNTLETNIGTFVVAGKTSHPEDVVKLNGVEITAESKDSSGVFALAVPLEHGPNTLTVTIESSAGLLVATGTKMVTWNSSLQTSGRRLLYVDAVVGESTDVPHLDGTVVIDPDHNVVLGLLPGKHVRGMSPNATEIYMEDRTVMSTATHETLRTLPFSQTIPGNGFLISPTGDRLYSRTEVVDVAANALLPPLPIDITTGNSWDSASVPGGPAVSPDGTKIYARRPMVIIDVPVRSYVDTGITGSSYYTSDIAVTPDSSRVLLSGYGSGTVYDATTLAAVGSFGSADFGGEIGFVDGGQKFVAGSSGNPRNGGGGVRLIDENYSVISQLLIPLADNLVTSAQTDEIFVSSGTRFGIDVLTLEDDSRLAVEKSFFLGINDNYSTFGRPKNDQIRKIVLKPASQLTLSLTAASVAENDGSEAAWATVTRDNPDFSSPLVVMLTSSDTSEATVPPQVIIPANEASTAFAVAAVDDGVFDGTQTVTITATAVGFADGINSVEVTEPPSDWGDAPDGPTSGTNYSTLLARNGAVHRIVDGFHLGAAIDAEDDGLPDPRALGDDDAALDDEDGVRFLTRIVPGTTARVEVIASDAGGLLNAWLDFNADGDWDDPGEHFVVDVPLAAGPSRLSFAVPPVAVVAPSTFSRFRFSTQAGLDYRGWAPDGEVEDYEVTIHAVRQWVIDSSGDGGDVNVGDGICDDGTGFCTLRAAIQEANAAANSAGGSDQIAFNIPGNGPHTIQPLSALPAIVDAVVIDATTQPGYAGTPLIELDGGLAGAGVSGLRFETGGNTVKGLAINRFAASGILVLTGGENTIQGNFLGTDATGTAAAPNAASGIDVRTAGNLIGGAGSGEGNLISGNANFGILLLGGAAENTIVGNRIGTDQTGTAAIGNALYGIYVTSPGNQIGGPAAGDGNLISGNLRGGVAVTGATATGNVVRGNRVGTTADGNAALPNGNAGITVSNVSGNTIGGTAAGAGNVLSGNALHGAMIVGAASTNNVVQGNLVGLNAAGTAAVPNGQYGITNYSPTSMIGGPAAGAGNTVSGNNFSGVLVYTPTATEVKVQGNRIGTNAAGTAAVPNGFYGVYVNSTDNLIGGAAAGEGNLISGNTRGGVALTERTAQRNVVQGNRIGTNPAGTAALANGGSGVTIAEGSNNTIGGTAAGAGNQISGNAAQGVIVVGVNATGNTVRGNLIGTNGAGTAAVANGQYGVAVYSSNTTIGGAGSGNTISGNAGGGVIVYGTTVTGTTVQGNRIGTDATGSLAVANGGHGVFVAASNSLIGGSATGEGNVIGWNASSGVYVAGATSAGNTIRQNLIFKNGLWGIDLAPWGPTANDPEDADTGTNNGQNFPELASAVLSGQTLSIAYSVPSSTANSAYPLAVEFFLADADGQEGQTYLGGESYPAPGSDSVALTVSGLSAGQRVVATATDANGNTSEFSSSVVVAAALLAPETMDGATSATLDAESLTPVVWQAIATWELAGLDAVRVASLHTVTFEIADLPGRYLGLATFDRIVLDIDAAGYGWYTAEPSEVPSSEMDLLTAVLHEMGHVLGLADLDDEDELMSSVLQPGMRQLPTAADIDRILAGGDWRS